jgi:YaiO family outer membrane protein
MASLFLLIGLLAQPAVTAAEAERLARSGQTAEALAAFEAIASQEANDLDSRVWIGRLLSRLGRVAEAEATYRQVIAADPRHVDARVGLAGVLLNASRVDDALAVVAEAERLDPESSDVLGVKARALRRAGRTTEALAAFEGAAARAPDDPDLQWGLEQTRRQVAHRVDAALARELYDDDLPPATIVDAVGDLFLDDAVRLSGRLQVQDRFGVTEARGGGGLEVRVGRALLTRAAVLVSPGADLVAQADVVGEVEWLRPRVQPALSVRYLDFAGAHVLVLGPSVTWDVSDVVAVIGRYYRSQSRFVLSGRTTGDNSALAGIRWRALPRMWLSGTYAYGIESFETASIDRFGQLRAHTLGGGVRFDLRTGTTLSLSPEYQWRSGDRRLIRITLAVSQHFGN